MLFSLFLCFIGLALVLTYFHANFGALIALSIGLLIWAFAWIFPLLFQNSNKWLIGGERATYFLVTFGRYQTKWIWPTKLLVTSKGIYVGKILSKFYSFSEISISNKSDGLVARPIEILVRYKAAIYKANFFPGAYKKQFLNDSRIRQVTSSTTTYEY